eukprot:4238-Hanusia_phi.AAC.2
MGQERWTSTMLIQTEISRLRWFASRKTACAVLAAWCSAIPGRREPSEAGAMQHKIMVQAVKDAWRAWVSLVNVEIFQSAWRYMRSKRSWTAWREEILARDGTLTLMAMHKNEELLLRLQCELVKLSSIKKLLRSQWLLGQNLRGRSLELRLLPILRSPAHVQQNLMRMVEAEAVLGYVGAQRYPIVSALLQAERVLPSLRQGDMQQDEAEQTAGNALPLGSAVALGSRARMVCLEATRGGGEEEGAAATSPALQGQRAGSLAGASESTRKV